MYSKFIELIESKKIYLLKIRDLFMSNFGINIKGIQYKNNIYECKYSFLFKFYPFYFTKFFAKLFNIRFIYELDNSYFITGDTKNHILPIIMSFKVDNLDLTPTIKYYNSLIPFDFFLKNNNIKSYQNIDIKYICKGKINYKLILKENIHHNNVLIYNLFDNL